MRRGQRRRTPLAMPCGTTLPDSWPGTRQSCGGRWVEDRGAELLVPGWIKPDWANWIRVTVVGRDPYALSGVRHLLARCGAIRLRVLADIPPSTAGFGDPDVVIWLRLRYDGLAELAGYVAALRRTHPQVRQLAISDTLPAGLAEQSCPLTGVWMATGQVRTDALYALLGRVLTTPAPRAPLLTPVLNLSQWRVLLLRAGGANSRRIADACGVSVKTVSVHESAIRERLGLMNQVEYAWLMRAVHAVMQAVPGLARRHWR
ncbi:helix-turn-helix transcriptional regulator [Klebsiella aerogenes]|uniref:helix-turn-helix transcriptional regulator n=1 Tax=Klebsiella aerogenes TaxID=548 RepID=UPI00190705E9|nr:LuxR C-terminal-related transcriptional regulator [Klebsiella aerogenes]MBK0469650.1 LuxR family transcriptional regulator [Klebsiella aerogenes]